MLEKAVRICDARFGEAFSVEDENICLMASHNTPRSFVDAIRQLATLESRQIGDTDSGPCDG
jgi:hypothetical protein